jgi:hypothetical protein
LGRTAARFADRRVTQLIGWQNLRASQEAAVARSNIQLIALKELAAYGQGGIKPETIAAFLQAFGIAAIAKGVHKAPYGRTLSTSARSSGTGLLCS